MWTLLSLACTGPEDTPEGSGTPTPPSSPTSPDWGVTDACSEEQPGGFDPLYEAGAVILAYGDSPEDEALAQQVHSWYAAEFAELTLRPASTLSEDEKAGSLMVLGSPSTNPLLVELGEQLPVRFDDLGFEFGGYRYEEPGHGIALISPNPFGSASWVVLYAGNTLDGAFSTFTVWTGGEDYVTTRGRGVVQQQGTLCHDEQPWTWYRRYDDDLRKPWERWTAELEGIETSHHTFFFEPGSEGEQDADWFPQWQEEQHARALEMLAIDPLDFPIRTYLYTTRDLKTEMTGVSGNGHANDLNYEVHALYGEGIHAVGAHEDVHVLAWHRIGAANSTLLGEGLAVWVDGVWQGESLADQAAQFRDAGEIPPLTELIDDFWSYDDLMTYPVAGHFVGFLVDGWGIEAVKRIYAAPDLEQALADETDLALAELEAAWLASIP
jgi:hypothetical protein